MKINDIIGITRILLFILDKNIDEKIGVKISKNDNERKLDKFIIPGATIVNKVKILHAKINMNIIKK